ncbi:MAG: serine/threonine-protein phosphatase [Nocardioides sp.]|nr:serine/threonine-protein phosphatase [Nocardioides sp.]
MTTAARVRPVSDRSRRRMSSVLSSRPDRLTLASLFLLATLVGAAMVGFPDEVPITAIVVPMVMGGLFLGPRALPWFVIYNLVLLTLSLPQLPTLNTRSVVSIVVLFLLGFIIMIASFRRSRLGIAGTMGETMLTELSDRIQGQGVLPDLPAPWHAESVIRSAGGTRFAGDFFVVGGTETGRLDVAVVDVSGKGDRAGSRALLLAGAMGGLVTAVEPQEFLSATNTYLINHPWQDGFATAVHLSVDLYSGAFQVWTAGHPPALHWRAGAGRWTPLESEGPMLGLIDEVDFQRAGGILRSGDALMLYTDGMVETRHDDIGIGIDRLIGQAERRLRSNFEGGARKLVDSTRTRGDDRALLLVWRD